MIGTITDKKLKYYGFTNLGDDSKEYVKFVTDKIVGRTYVVTLYKTDKKNFWNVLVDSSCTVLKPIQNIYQLKIFLDFMES